MQNRNDQLRLFQINPQHRFSEEVFPQDSLICPWCFNLTNYSSEDEIVCTVCGREITEDDLNSNNND